MSSNTAATSSVSPSTSLTPSSSIPPNPYANRGPNPYLTSNPQFAAHAEAQRKASQNYSFLKDRLRTAALGFGMGAFVGGTVVILHFVVNRLPMRGQMWRNVALSGSAFGTIFAVGSQLRG